MHAVHRLPSKCTLKIESEKSFLDTQSVLALLKTRCAPTVFGTKPIKKEGIKIK